MTVGLKSADESRRSLAGTPAGLELLDRPDNFRSSVGDNTGPWPGSGLSACARLCVQTSIRCVRRVNTHGCNPADPPHAVKKTSFLDSAGNV